jgi:alanine racemase/UDP-N-acetylmuramoyl-tripeptide--D-alanyl-D-alanine ligase
LIAHVRGEQRGARPTDRISQICIDSRGAAPGSLFVALRGENTDGHHFLHDAFRNKATAALVSDPEREIADRDPDWPLIVVPSPLQALQELAAWYRRRYIDKTIVITGSNGKTIVKDALAVLLASRNVHASPGSYNSKLGLPLAVLSSERESELTVLEAGVSAPGEMTILEGIAKPDYGILTNIGLAHFAAFGSQSAIAKEKMALFANVSPAGWVSLPRNEPLLMELVKNLRCPSYEVGSANDPLSFIPGRCVQDGQVVEIADQSGERFEIRVRTRSPEIVIDLQIAASAAFNLGVGASEIAAALEGYAPPQTRMELWSSPEGIRIINDACSSDPISANAALRAAGSGSNTAGRKFFAFSGMRQMGQDAASSHHQVGMQAAESGFTDIFLVGNGLLEHTANGFLEKNPTGRVMRVGNPDELRHSLRPLLRAGDTVLFKGPRNDGMAGAARELAGSISQRCLRVDLGAIAGNVSRFRRHCGAHPKIMAMLKALAYGTELVQLAFWMPKMGIHHIGVSATAEGVAIRKTGVNQEIYVFLSAPDDLPELLRYRLTPILYSADLLEAFAKELAGSTERLSVHLKVDTGMHRLGVAPGEALKVARRLRDLGNFDLTGLCTHFAAADDQSADDFTRGQISVFDGVVAAIKADGFGPLLVHAANTSATVRFPEAHYDMVRVGLGLYGVYTSEHVRQGMELDLALAVTSRVATIRNCEKGDRIGYNGTFTAPSALRIGVVPFGYDDGLPWQRSGRGVVLFGGRPAPIIGRISMDQMQVDLTALPDVEVGDEALIYGAHGGYALRPETVAQEAGTISHELLTRLGRRVRRIYREP